MTVASCVAEAAWEMNPARRELTLTPIGLVRSPLAEKSEASRQATVGESIVGEVHVFPEYRDALSDLEGFTRIWLLFWFDRAEHWRSKVLPPRSEVRRGVFATRSPHRPNPIGISAVRLERIDGCILHVQGLDLVDETPVFDIKPYLAYSDSFADASAGWLEQKSLDPIAAWHVVWRARATEAAQWIFETTSVEVHARITKALELGPVPHAYRRIRRQPDGSSELAVKSWRARFSVDDAARTIFVESIHTGYRPSELARNQDQEHEVARLFVARFG